MSSDFKKFLLLMTILGVGALLVWMNHQRVQAERVTERLVEAVPKILVIDAEMEAWDGPIDDHVTATCKVRSLSANIENVIVTFKFERPTGSRYAKIYSKGHSSTDEIRKPVVLWPGKETEVKAQTPQLYDRIHCSADIDPNSPYNFRNK